MFTVAGGLFNYVAVAMHCVFGQVKTSFTTDLEAVPIYQKEVKHKVKQERYTVTIACIFHISA